MTVSNPASADQFPTDPSGLPESSRSEVVEVADGGEVELLIAPVAKRLGDATVRMLAYNGSIPGPDAEGAGGVGGGRQRRQRG